MECHFFSELFARKQIRDRTAGSGSHWSDPGPTALEQVKPRGCNQVQPRDKTYKRQNHGKETGARSSQKAHAQVQDLIQQFMGSFTVTRQG